MKKTITISMLLSAASVASVMAADVIPAPTFTNSKEWLYVGDERGDTLRIKCEAPWHEELYPDYFSWAGMELKEADSTVKFLAPNIYNGASDLYALLGFTVEGEDVTYFDYNWQPGDSAVILSLYNECTGICSLAYGKRIKVLSKDSVEISGEMRCRYNLESQRVGLYREGDNLMVIFPEVGEGAEIAVYDASGRTVLATPLCAGATKAVLPMANMPRGAYIVTLTSTGYRPMTAKMVW